MTHPASNHSSVAIALDEVSKRYPHGTGLAVNDLNLEMQTGEITVLVGPSGCGKTTTLKMLNRLIEPTSGRILINGEDTANLKVNDLRRQIGYVIQEVGLFPHLTVAKNIGIVPGILGWDKLRTRARVEELLLLLGLDPHVYAKRLPRQLSGGQKQRVGVARALAADPPILLMDEPFTATDPQTRENLQNQLLEMQSKLRKSIVFVTHDIDEAVKLGDRIAVFGVHSRVEQYDTPDRLLSAPANEFVRAFVGAGATYRRLSLRRVHDATLVEVATSTGQQHRGKLGTRPYLLRLDEAARPVEWVYSSGRRVPCVSVRTDTLLATAMDGLLRAHGMPVAVVDATGRYVGSLDFQSVTATLAAEDEVVADLRSLRGSDLAGES